MTFIFLVILLIGAHENKIEEQMTGDGIYKEILISCERIRK